MEIPHDCLLAEIEMYLDVGKTFLGQLYVCMYLNFCITF